MIKVRGAPDLPLRFAVVAGEVIHHLRSTLDHLVVALAARNGQDPLNQHQFPVCRKQDKFEKAVRGGCTKGISASALKLIADAQPYLRPRPDDYFLTTLHELDVVDKHRLLLVVAAAARMGQRVDIGVDEAKAAELGITPVDVAIIGLGIPIRCKISESPTEIFRIMLAEPDPVFHADVDIICDVAFEKCGSIEMPSIIVALESLRKATARLVDKFANEF